MKTIYLLTAALCLLITSNTYAQQDSAAMMKAWMDYMTPGPIHQKMAIGDGEWTADMTMWDKPDGPPTKTTGACVNKMILGGRYCESRYTANMMGMPFEGIGTMAYDNQRKVFIDTWIDNMGTGITIMEGNWNDATHSLELKGKVVDPLTGKDCWLRQVTTWKDKDHQVMEMFRSQDGNERKEMEIALTRK
ncbi:MAG: DUF1579 domain-containing protein [Chitinophaga sp.]|uniref:DUF1579 domain-containing protein n=1 Tax=Chitinophaga sp. TaxID=1869181 RepID=UPI001B04FA8B|nr:DUF1579 domain-containing protein [Chitinophaga sp.]MBO9727391.1 DUF1579 domain-containing protein [Chitinophaga sp.]